MRVPRVKVQPLPHAVFLSRLASATDSNAIEVRLGQAAFLTLRLVDLLSRDHEPPHPDAFMYQHLATERFCRDLQCGGPEEAHLKGLVGTAAHAYRLGDARVVAPALLAYALYLEDGARYEEALDVLETTLQVGGDRLRVADAVAATLRLARVNRKLTRFSDAETAYVHAGQLAAAAGDGYAVLLSRIGLAGASQGRGNLAEAERCYREILADARIAAQREPEAHAEHGLATTLLLRGQPAEAAPNMVTDFLLKVGVGHARFGHFAKAETFLATALETAAANGLHEFEFRIERIRNGLGDCEKELASSCAEATEPVTSEPLRSLRQSLQELAAVGA